MHTVLYDYRQCRHTVSTTMVGSGSQSLTSTFWSTAAAAAAGTDKMNACANSKSIMGMQLAPTQLVPGG